MLIKVNGFILAESAPVAGKRLYIMGLSEIPLSREVTIQVDPLGVKSGAVVSWGGDMPPRFSLSWSLTAGFDHVAVKDRDALLTQIKLAHALGASAGITAKKLLRGPPRVRLVIPGHINCIGVLTRVATTEKGPWDTKSSQLPTKCDFAIEFTPFPGYDPEKIIKVEKDTWTASEIVSRFYQG